MNNVAKVCRIISVVNFVCCAHAITPDRVATPLLESDQTRSEWADFVRARIPKLPAPSDAGIWNKDQSRLRNDLFQKIIFNGVAASWYKSPVNVVWGDVVNCPGYRIRKLRYEGAPGMWIPALLYEPAGLTGRSPAVLTVNGHAEAGKSDTSEQLRSIALAKRGVIALHPEWISFGELHHADNQHNQLSCLNLCGVSGLSVFYLAMKRGLDVLAEYPSVDAGRIAMTGLSGGGWQTILLSAMEPRIALSVPNAGYSGIEARVNFPGEIGDLEQVPPDLLTVADFTHLTAMLAPRPALLIYNAKDDCCFQADHMAASVFDPVVPYYAMYGRTEDFDFYINQDPGTHNYDADNRRHFFAFLSKQFGLGWGADEPDCLGEVKSKEELQVGLPASNATLVSLAESIVDGTPTAPAPKGDDAALAKWQTAAQDRLRKVIRLTEWPAAAASKLAEDASDNARVSTYKLRTGPWTVPAYVWEPTQKTVAGTTVLFGDAGKSSLAEVATQLLDTGQRVVMVDLLFQGECTCHPKEQYQYADVIETTGERVLGQNVAQLGSIVAWSRETFQGPVAVESKGWVSGVVALMYGGLHRADINRLATQDAPATLKDLIHQRIPYKTHYALFCFGLLREFDVSDLAALCQNASAERTRLK